MVTDKEKVGNKLSKLLGSILRNSIFCSLLFVVSVAAQELRNGQIRSGETVEAWDADQGAWVTPEAFWESYARASGGLTWGRSDSYPVYRDVNEHDTFMVILESGPCLMEFFHSRWRRANDVRRWDPAFNEYGGCPHVFD